MLEQNAEKLEKTEKKRARKLQDVENCFLFFWEIAQICLNYNNFSDVSE